MWASIDSSTHWSDNAATKQAVGSSERGDRMVRDAIVGVWLAQACPIFWAMHSQGHASFGRLLPAT